MSKFRRLGVLALIGTLLFGTAACAESAPPDQIGLYFEKGPIEGYKFSRCIQPGDTGWVVNDEIIMLPSSVRTWNIAPQGGDSSVPITVNSKPEEGQPSGVAVNLWVQVTFTLNTDCDGGENSPIVKFWNAVGRRYKANETDGWAKMLQNTVVPALEASSRSIAKSYTADDMVAGTVREAIQSEISALFQGEIDKVAGGAFFCSPFYDPDSDSSEGCGEVSILVKDVDYSNPAIQAARDEKQAAIERATALVAEAQGKVEAAAKTGSLYDNPAWVELELAKLELEKAKACAASPTCTIVLDGGSGVLVNAR